MVTISWKHSIPDTHAGVVSRVTASGAGPPRLSVLSASIALSSSADNSKSKTSKLPAMQVRLG